jgi:hypothetical protein
MLCDGIRNRPRHVASSRQVAADRPLANL